MFDTLEDYVEALITLSDRLGRVESQLGITADRLIIVQGDSDRIRLPTPRSASPASIRWWRASSSAAALLASLAATSQ